MKLIPKAKPVRISIDCYHGIEHVSPNTLKNYFYIPDIEKHINDGSLRRFLDQHGISPFPEDADIYNVADLLFATEGHITDEKSMLNWWCEKEEYRNNLNLFFEEKFSAKDLSENSLDLEPFKEPRLMEFIVGFLLKKADKEASHAEIFLKIASELGSEEAKERLEEKRLKKKFGGKITGKIDLDSFSRAQSTKRRRVRIRIEEEGGRGDDDRSKKNEATIISPSINLLDKEKEEFLKMKQIYLRNIKESSYTLFNLLNEKKPKELMESRNFSVFYCYLLFILACGSNGKEHMQTLYENDKWNIHESRSHFKMTKTNIGMTVRDYIFSSNILPTDLEDDANRLLNANEQILPTVVKEALERFFEYVETWS